ncbi:MAG: alpha/beta hydrolase [Clostridia bacterium]|nr:alpha/beta hydrolase [Clostridia bacterium]
MSKNYYNGAVSLGDTQMYYVRLGAGPKNAVIIPGLSDGLVTVKGKAALLGKPYREFFRDFTVYMFSRKEHLPQDYSIREMAADQAEAMRILGLSGACVLGVSEGGMIVQYLACDYSELVGRLVLAVTAPYANGHVQAFVKKRIEEAKRGDHRAIMIGSAESEYSEKKLKSYRKLYPLLGLVGKPKSYGRFLSNANAILRFDARDVISQIRCPTLIIGGEEDKTVGPEGSEELHISIENSRLHMYPGLGHAAFEEAPDFNKKVFGFFGGER